MKKIGPTAEPAKPEDNQYPRCALNWELAQRDTRSGRKEGVKMSSVPKDDHLGVKTRGEGDAPGASVPHSAAPSKKAGTVRRADDCALPFEGVSSRVCRVNQDGSSHAASELLASSPDP